AIRSYIFLMALNGFAPFLAFLAAFERRFWFLFIAFAFTCFAYWLIGIKVPMLLVLVMGWAGVLSRKNLLKYLAVFFILISVGISVIAAVEQYIFSYSYIADYFIRRAYAVVVQLQGAYVAYMLENFRLQDWLVGFAQSP